ncbi:hypothetical protein BCR42DRAFT_395194 [Absidia repens]|uniref:NAD(P)-binding protein n=1 Tax=Absidia repens TaxID=90262 RepID=A0A1X2I8D3_9FUNG|nr:hypothetical protein BCR42DRAFT_395194 [Absidia repens]
MNSLNMFSLQGKKAIVTGGGRGLGLEMSKALAGTGADVALMYVSTETTHETAAAIAKEFNVQCKAYKAEMADYNQVNAAMDQIYKDFGKIDILVANAGIAVGGSPAESFEMENWERIFNVNVHGLFNCAKSAGNHMLKHGKGSIILISSVAGMVATNPQPQCGYNTSKGAVTAMVKSLAQEWAKRGIRVNSINPAYMLTEMLKDVAGSHPEVSDKWKEYTPMGRLGNPDELNGAVIYLASDASSYMTGTHICIDGGYTCV